MSNAIFGKSKPTAEKRPGFKAYKYGHLLPVRTAESLLEGRHHRDLIEYVQNIVKMEDKEFSDLYGALIHRFAELVQLLPDSHGDYLGSLLNNGLTKGFLALREYQKRYMTPHAMKREIEQVKTPLMCYAVFSAALLQDVAKVLTQQRVVLCDKAGEFIKFWHPFESTMLGQASHYRLYDVSGVYDLVEDDLVVMLARQIMPELGFDWISENTDIFIEWLHALKKDYTFAGRIIDVMNILDKLIAENALELNALPFIDVDMLECPENAIGEAFLIWLKNGLADGSLNTNESNAGIHHVQEGAFLEYPFLAKEFTKVFGQETPMARVFAQFGNLFGITKKSGQDFAFDQFFSTMPEMQETRKSAGFGGIMSSKQSSTRQGIVIKDTHVIFQGGNLPLVSENLKAMKVEKQRMSYTFQAAAGATALKAGFKRKS